VQHTLISVFTLYVLYDVIQCRYQGVLGVPQVATAVYGPVEQQFKAMKVWTVVYICIGRNDDELQFAWEVYREWLDLQEKLATVAVMEMTNTDMYDRLDAMEQHTHSLDSALPIAKHLLQVTT